jgi:YVTN family beta-propeller protein
MAAPPSRNTERELGERLLRPGDDEHVTTCAAAVRRAGSLPVLLMLVSWVCTVSMITMATGAVSPPITVGIHPIRVAITPDGKHAYVTNAMDGTVSVITTATGAGSPPITVGKVPRAVAICPAPSTHRR